MKYTYQARFSVLSFLSFLCCSVLIVGCDGLFDDLDDIAPPTNGDVGVMDADEPDADEPDADEPDADEPDADVPVINECGGTQPLDGEPNESCVYDEDNVGVWVCDGDNAVVCEKPDPEYALQHANDECESTADICELTSPVDEFLELAVRVVADGESASGVSVDFEIVDYDGSETVTLEADNAESGENGVASVELRTGDFEDVDASPGVVQIEASLSDEPDVEPIIFEVEITPQDVLAEYIIAIVRAGSTPVDNIDIFLFDPDMDCEELFGLYLDNQGFIEATAELSADVDSEMGVINDVIYADAEAGDSFALTVLATRDVEGEQVHVGSGCNEEAQEFGEETDLETVIGLVDHLPRLNDEYSLDHELDIALSESFSDEVESIVQLVSTFGDTPGESFFGCPDGTDFCEDQVGLADLVLEAELLSGAAESSLENLRGNSMDYEIARDFIQDALSFMPSWAHDPEVIEVEIDQMLKTFEVTGEMSFSAQPEPEIDDQTGETVGHFSEDSTSQQWENFIFQWPFCSEGNCNHIVPVSDINFSGDMVGEFDAAVSALKAMGIDRHTISLSVEYLAVSAIEYVVAARVFESGQAAANIPLRDALEPHIDCESLKDAVGGGPAIEQLCEEIIHYSTEALYAYVDEDHSFQLSTPENEPCSIYEPDSYEDDWWSYPLPYIEAIGQPGDEGCSWDVELVDDNDNPIDVEGSGQFKSSTP